MPDQFRFNSTFIHEFRPGNWENSGESETVYHYTSAEAFLNIIKGDAVRFSDIRYMNDTSETKVCVKRMIEFIEEKGEIYPHFRDAVNELLKSNDYSMIKDLSANEIKYTEFIGLRFTKQRNFIFCTSKDADSLNMWNYYASNGAYTGYNIGLSVPAFLKTFDVENISAQDGFIVFYGNVLYEKKQHFAAIEEIAQTIEKSAMEYPSIYHISKAATVIRTYIELRGVFFKDGRFKSENEYRFLFSIADKRIPHSEKDAQKYTGLYNKRLCEDFCVKQGLIVPFMKVSIPKNAIRRITMAPMTETEIAKSSIKELLNTMGFKNANGQDIPIFKSKIPIRF